MGLMNKRGARKKGGKWLESRLGKERVIGRQEEGGKAGEAKRARGLGAVAGQVCYIPHYLLMIVKLNDLGLLSFSLSLPRVLSYGNFPTNILGRQNVPYEYL